MRKTPRIILQTPLQRDRAFMRDVHDDLQLNFLCDATHGAASLKDGQIEMMLHRRCIDDDGRGVGEVKFHF